VDLLIVESTKVIMSIVMFIISIVKQKLTNVDRESNPNERTTEKGRGYIK